MSIALAPTGTGDPTFAVAFGGGGARGLAHIHVIETLNELGIVPVAIAGSSIGAIMGAAMASGMTGAEIAEYARSILCRRRAVASRMWSARPGSLAEIREGGLHITQFNVERLLKAFLPPSIPGDFAELSIPLKVTATDYYGHCVSVLQEGDLTSALAASAAIPAVFRPVRRGGRLLIDGGIYNPVPFDLLRDTADIVIAVDVVGAPEEVDADRQPTSVDLMFGATQLMMQSIIAARMVQYRPDILLRPAVSRFRVLDFLKIEQILSETTAVRDELKRAVAAAVDTRRAFSA